jgi:hypothetical protein
LIDKQRRGVNFSYTRSETDLLFEERKILAVVLFRNKDADTIFNDELQIDRMKIFRNLISLYRRQMPLHSARWKTALEALNCV